MAKKVEITQKEYDKFIQQSKELEELKQQAKEKTVKIVDLEKANAGYENENIGLKNEIDKKDRLLSIANETISDFKKEAAETKETVSVMSRKVGELARENKRLTDIEKAYIGMKEAVKVILAHSK